MSIPMAQLTKREHDVALWIVQGETYKMIAYHLHMKLSTVETHVHHIFIKTGAHSRSEFTALWHKLEH